MTSTGSHDIARAIAVFNEGGIVIFPTDTAYGIGCRIDCLESITKLFSIRKRSETQAMPVLVNSMAMALAYFANPSDKVTRLMNNYWPGGLTIVSMCREDRVPSLVRGGGKTVGIRMPNHSELLQVISSVGVPILGSSANFHGLNTPYAYNDLDPDLVALVDYVLPGVCLSTKASTVVDCSVSPSVIRRHGAVNLTESDL